MGNLRIEPFRVLQTSPRISGCRTGFIVSIDTDTFPVVNFSGNPFGPQRARVIASMTAKMVSRAYKNHSCVLLIFEDNDPMRPIVIDVVKERAAAPCAVETIDQEQTDARSFVPVSRSVPSALTARIAMIVGVEDDSVLVREVGESFEAVKASSTIELRNLKDPVVVMSAADGSLIIVGQIYPRVVVNPLGADCANIVLKGARVAIEADVELVLKAGGCTIRLDARGKAVTSADQIVSRARRSNKVQGGSVQLN